MFRGLFFRPPNQKEDIKTKITFKNRYKYKIF